MICKGKGLSFVNFTPSNIWNIVLEISLFAQVEKTFFPRLVAE